MSIRNRLCEYLVDDKIEEILSRDSSACFLFRFAWDRNQLNRPIASANRICAQAHVESKVVYWKMVRAAPSIGITSGTETTRDRQRELFLRTTIVLFRKTLYPQAHRTQIGRALKFATHKRKTLFLNHNSLHTCARKFPPRTLNCAFHRRILSVNQSTMSCRSRNDNA